jgi:hypothetical protein
MLVASLVDYPIYPRCCTLCGGQSVHAMWLTRYCIASMRADHKPLGDAAW